VHHTPDVLWWAVAATVITGAIWIVTALTTPTTAGGISGFISPVGAAATLIASIGAAATGRDTSAGTRAGVLTAVLTAPIQFTVTMTALLHLHHWTPTDPYDIAAYPHSGYPDIASYLLSDTIGGNILVGFVLYPVTLSVVARIGAAAGTHLRRPSTGHAPIPG
jgi:hypothetical protein